MQDVVGEPVSAHDVAREIRRRLPSVGTTKLHKLLYCCQGHHLGTFEVPLFAESISAWDRGPVVARLWTRERTDGDQPEPRDLTEAQLNTVGYVLSRYGSMTGRDLEILTHNQTPWLRADDRRKPGQSAKIEREWMLAYFATDLDEDILPLDSAEVAKLLKGAEQRRSLPARPDDLEALRERLLSAAG